MSETSAIRPGVVIGETYEITELLGEGGMGTVWTAKHLRLPGKRVAIKVLHGVAAGDRESYARFRREAEIASRIGHPNIVTVHDFNVLASGEPYLVLEFLDGEDLAHRLLRGKLPLGQALGIARQIGSALHAAHKADVVHRDLKPGNIFLMPTEVGGELVDQVKVLDFGISKIRGSQTVQTQDAVLLGTPQYMAPEQALGRNTEIDARTDVFALGAIVYEMLSGRPAFTGNTLAEVVFKVVYAEPTPLGELCSDAPKNVLDAVAQALAKDPAQRFSDVAAFINALTGRPLPTLDRARAGSAAPEAFASTAPGLALGSTGAPSAHASSAPATTGARGELSPLIPPTQAPPRPRSMLLPFGLAALAVLVVGGLGALRLLQSPSSTTTAAPTAPPTTTAPPPPSSQPTLEPPPAPAPLPTVVAPPMLRDGRDVELKSAPARLTRPGRAEPIPPEVAAALAAAEQAMGSDPSEAIRLARRSLATAKTSRAFAIVARGFCKQGNLGDAKAALHSVSGSERAAVVRYCKAAGTDLE